METLGGRLQLRVSGGLGEDPTSHLNLALSPVSPPLPSLWVSPHSDSLLYTGSAVPVQNARSRCAAPNSRRLCRCFMMTHCAAGAKQARVCAAALVRALRSRLKSLGCLLLQAGSDAGRQQPAQTFSRGQREQPGRLNRKKGGPVLDCCGPARPSLTVSSNV